MQEICTWEISKVENNHTKLDNIEYGNLKLQEYLESTELSVEECKVVMLWQSLVQIMATPTGNVPYMWVTHRYPGRNVQQFWRNKEENYTQLCLYRHFFCSF